MFIFETHRYNEFEQLITRAAASGALENPTSQQLLAQMKLAQGDPVAAQSLLEQVPLDYSPRGWIWEVRFTAASLPTGLRRGESDHGRYSCQVGGSNFRWATSGEFG